VGRRHRLLAVLTALPLGALALGACGGADEVDAGSIESAVPAAVLPDHPDLVTDVSCPGPIDREVGLVSACTALIGGNEVGISVTQVDDDGTIDIDVDRALLDVDDLAARIAERLTTDVGVPTSVLCDGPAVRVLSVGDEVVCIATDTDDRDRTFVAEILDEAANYDLRLG
jgi:hypothetical protein